MHTKRPFPANTEESKLKKQKRLPPAMSSTDKKSEAKMVHTLSTKESKEEKVSFLKKFRTHVDLGGEIKNELVGLANILDKMIAQVGDEKDICDQISSALQYFIAKCPEKRLPDRYKTLIFKHSYLVTEAVTKHYFTIIDLIIALHPDKAKGIGRIHIGILKKYGKKFSVEEFKNYCARYRDVIPQKYCTVSDDTAINIIRKLMFLLTEENRKIIASQIIDNVLLHNSLRTKDFEDKNMDEAWTSFSKIYSAPDFDQSNFIAQTTLCSLHAPYTSISYHFKASSFYSNQVHQPLEVSSVSVKKFLLKKL